MNPKDRPDYVYWKADRKGRSQMDIKALNKKLEAYSLERFTLGRRFVLARAYAGTPAGTGCTVTKIWPDTRVLWDKWSKHEPRETTMSFALDICLDPEDE